MSYNLAKFLAGEQANQDGRFITDILSWPDSTLERQHDYIQWVFPTTRASDYNHECPVLNGSSILQIKSNSQAVKNFELAIDRMLEFYENTSAWLRHGDHNQRRISRILNSIALILGRDDAEDFYRTLITIANQQQSAISPETRRMWQSFFTLAK